MTQTCAQTPYPLEITTNGMDSVYKSMFSDYPDILRVEDVQKLLGISRHQVYSLILSGQVRGIKLGKAYKIPKILLIDYLLGDRV